ncbi:SAM-dependent methyltransferase, partial [Frankia sp. AvcI1]
RSRAEVESLFGGLELIDPGVELVHRWRPDAPDPPGLTDAQVSVYGGIARKP